MSSCHFSALFIVLCLKIFILRAAQLPDFSWQKDHVILLTTRAKNPSPRLHTSQTSQSCLLCGHTEAPSVADQLGQFATQQKTVIKCARLSPILASCAPPADKWDKFQLRTVSSDVLIWSLSKGEDFPANRLPSSLSSWCLPSNVAKLSTLTACFSASVTFLVH